jgi:hypothetical protein
MFKKKKFILAVLSLLTTYVAVAESRTAYGMV